MVRRELTQGRRDRAHLPHWADNANVTAWLAGDCGAIDKQQREAEVPRFLHGDDDDATEQRTMPRSPMPMR